MYCPVVSSRSFSVSSGLRNASSQHANSGGSSGDATAVAPLSSNKDEEMAGKLRDLQSIYAAVVLAGFGLGRPLDVPRPGTTSAGRPMPAKLFFERKPANKKQRAVAGSTP
jgi:hypothetical protein